VNQATARGEHKDEIEECFLVYGAGGTEDYAGRPIHLRIPGTIKIARAIG